MGKIFFAISDPTRRRILEYLKERDLTPGEIAERFDISKPSISHHLNVLREAGLVSVEKQGQYLKYSINTTVFQDVLAWIMSIAGGRRGHED
ncbi:MAG: autorepressor SdpR family transcription factor [Firmicutes bacterium]|jgi:DNA-binding transcriptional ArsR family regulator|nr:autorepressor SdpR family transcription factor [Bacillota bacterium]